MNEEYVIREGSQCFGVSVNSLWRIGLYCSEFSVQRVPRNELL